MSNGARAGARKAVCVTSLGLRVCVGAAYVSIHVCAFTNISLPPLRSLPRSIVVANRYQYYRHSYYYYNINRNVRYRYYYIIWKLDSHYVN